VLLSPQGSAWASLGSQAHQAGSARVSFPASSPESALALQGSDSAGSLSHLAILPGHFRLAIVSIQAGWVERVSFLQPLHVAKHPE
jgi:hypothetical protein